MRLSKPVYLHKSPNLDIFICNFCFKPSPFEKLSVKCQIRPRLLIFHSAISLSHKKFLFWKFLRRHCMWLLVWAPLPQSKILATPMHGRWHFKPCPPQITACVPQARVNFCSSTTSKLLPKNRSPQTIFSMKQQDRSSERNQVAFDFAMKTFFSFFWSSPLNLKVKSIQKKDNIGFGAKYSPDRFRIPNSSSLGCVSVPHPSFCATPFPPPPQTHYSGSVPGTILFYSLCAIYTVVCDQIVNKSLSFVLLNASILRKYRGKTSLRSASF